MISFRRLVGVVVEVGVGAAFDAGRTNAEEGRRRGQTTTRRSV